MNPEGDREPAGNPGADAGTPPAPVDEPRDLMPEAPRRNDPVVSPKQPEVVEPAPEIRREPMDEPQPEPKPTPAEPKLTPSEPKPIPAEPKPIPAEPKLTPAEPKTSPAEPKTTPAEPKTTPAEPKAPAPESKPRPEDENLFEVLSDAAPAWRVQRRFAVGAAEAEEPVTPDGDRVEPVTHLEPSAPKAVSRVPFDPAAETRRLRATR
jgi:hypothetical protein